MQVSPREKAVVYRVPRIATRFHLRFDFGLEEDTVHNTLLSTVTVTMDETFEHFQC